MSATSGKANPSAEADQALAERVVTTMMERDAFSRWLGIEILDVRPRGVTIRMVVRDEMLNGFGVCHGGALFSLADSALAFACNTHGRVTVSIENSITYPTAIRAGDDLTAEAIEESATRRLAFYRVEIRRGGAIVSIFRGTVYDTEKPFFCAFGMNPTAFLIDGVRTPVGNLGGALSDARSDDLAALVISELMRRNARLDPARVSDVVMGCANQAGEDNRNVARMAALLAGLPTSVPGETVNRLCASGMSAVVSAARAVKLGDGDFYVAGGVESMTRAPYAMSKGSKPFARDIELFDTSLGWRFVNPLMKSKYGTDSMGQTAENVAEQYHVSRGDQDLFALRSQQKAAHARGAGRFATEIVPVQTPQKKGPPKCVDADEFLRPGTTLEILASLKPAFRTEGGSVTAGNSSGLNDGAAALLIASEAGMKELGATPLARVVASAVAGVEPRIMGMGPVPSTRQALARAGLTLDQMDVVELNEAFAAQSLACLRELGVADDDPRVNPNGGAIALGHPLGMSGARLLLTAARELEKHGGRYALCTMCIGVGQGMATILERV